MFLKVKIIAVCLIEHVIIFHMSKIAEQSTSMTLLDIKLMLLIK